MSVRAAFACLACSVPLFGCGIGGESLPPLSEVASTDIVVVAIPAAGYGTVRSDGLSQPLLMVGDEGANLLTDRAVVSFDLAGFPPVNHVVAARLWVESRGLYGQALGSVDVLRIDAGATLDGADFASPGLSEILDGAPPPPYGFALVLDVTLALRDALDRGAGHLDLRLQTERLGNGDASEDLLKLEHRADPSLGNHGPELVLTARR